MPERLKAILDKITAWWKKFNTKQRSVLISIVAVVIVALVILGVVISRPTQVELVEAQSASEASTIKGVLEDNNISYEVDSKLVFFVNKSDEVNAIMALGDNGIPAQAYSIDNVTDGSFSTTEADKQKKYQVYLEDKLKDHLEKQSYVNEASVDITMPDKDGTILKSKEEATAAVTLGLKDSITDDQAYAIARLVATALGNDTTKGITIIDKKANVLYSGGDSDTSAGLATSQLSYKQKLEEQVKNEVKKTLESSNIFSNIEVGMNLDIDFSKTETAQKNYTLPDGQTDTGLLDSESNYQSDATNGQAAVPGTDSNSDDTTYSLEVLSHLQKESIKTPVVVVSTLTIEGADEAIKSLELGAFDFVTKPNNIIEAKGNQFKETLLRVVYAAVRITPAHSASRNLTVVEKKAGAIVNKHKAAGSNKIVAIASSTGGPKALQSVIPFLPAELLAPVVLVQHMPAGFTKSMAERLNELSQVQVKEASNGEVLKNGVVYIAPGGTHIAIKKSGASHVISFNDMPPISGLKPCANIMFDSLTSSNYDEVVCVVLTGMGADGTNGILSLGKSKPIYVIAQDEKSSVVYGMPRAIYEAGVVDEVVTLSDVAKAITKNVGVK